VRLSLRPTTFAVTEKKSVLTFVLDQKLWSWTKVSAKVDLTKCIGAAYC